MRYETDPYNRLVVQGGKKSGVKKFRRILDGRFKIDKNNGLSYHVKAPLAEDETVPHQIKFKGNWVLTDKHELKYIIDNIARPGFGSQILLQGEIMDARADSLMFSIKTRTKDRTGSLYTLSLGGVWQADPDNRLSFNVQKEKGKHDILTFSGAWDIDKSHQIVYEYEKRELIKKTKRVHSFLLKGKWDIREKYRISYVLGKKDGSILNFETNAGIFRENYIKYELGVKGSLGARPVKRNVVLCGKWKLKRNAGLMFDVKCGGRKLYSLVFGAETKLTGKDTVLFSLKNDIENKDIGASLKLSHKMPGRDGEAFLELLRSNKEAAIYAGAAWRW
ncbi:MAG: hypothetical protein ABIG55_05395 [Candidatus Omnitrophota bacterium]|nr:hypothetical protein [Candidatus Omnitrophota bacterium]